jgi:hypothetical protein
MLGALGLECPETVNVPWLSSWPISIRSLNTFRPGEFVVLLVSALIAECWFMVAVAVHIPPAWGLGLWMLPLAVLLWIAWRRAERTERKLRLLASEDVCLNCGYRVNEAGSGRKILDRCPECGDALAEHRSRACVQLPATFVFPELELAASDSQASEWLRAASAKAGWLGRHPLMAAIGAMVGVTAALQVVLIIITIWIEIPDDVGGLMISLILACDITALALTQQLWHRRLSRAIHALRLQSV